MHRCRVRFEDNLTDVRMSVASTRAQPQTGSVADGSHSGSCTPAPFDRSHDEVVQDQKRGQPHSEPHAGGDHAPASEKTFEHNSPQVDPSESLQEDLCDEVRTTLASINETVIEIERRRQESLVEMRQAAIELGVSIASHLIHEQIEGDDFAVEKLVESVIAELPTRRTVTIRLHPDDLAQLECRLQGRSPPWQNASAMQFVPDESLDRGDCHASDEQTGILSRIDLQLSELRQHLLESLDDAQIERRRTQTQDQDLRRFPDRRQSN